MVDDNFGGDFGNQVIIETNQIRHLYAHLSQVDVSPGDMVHAGQRIGLSGQSGNAPGGAHLHYEERVDPYHPHCEHDRRPEFDQEGETDEMTPEQEAKLDDLIDRVRQLQQRTVVNDEGEAIEIDLAVERLLRLVRREFTPEP